MGVFDRLRADPVYNTGAVVQRTGVPADTFRAWERRYGVPMPTRTAGNQRLYSERDVAVIAWLRDQTHAGITISQAVALYRSRPPDGTDADRDAARHQRPSGGSISSPDDLVAALLGYDAEAADRVVAEAAALLSVEEVCLRLLQPALYEIGHRWARGEIEISVEHFASAFVLRKLGGLFNASQPEQGRGPLVAACLEGELHEVGLLLTCLFLSRRGFGVVYLGANLPLADLLGAIDRIQPPLVLLSASTPPAAIQLGAASREIKARWVGAASIGSLAPPAIGFGGHVFVERPELRAEVDGVFLGRNADEATEAVERLVAERAA